CAMASPGPGACPARCCMAGWQQAVLRCGFGPRAILPRRPARRSGRLWATTRRDCRFAYRRRDGELVRRSRRWIRTPALGDENHRRIIDWQGGINGKKGENSSQQKGVKMMLAWPGASGRRCGIMLLMLLVTAIA